MCWGEIPIPEAGDRELVILQQSWFGAGWDASGGFFSTEALDVVELSCLHFVFVFSPSAVTNNKHECILATSWGKLCGLICTEPPETSSVGKCRPFLVVAAVGRKLRVAVRKVPGPPSPSSRAGDVQLTVAGNSSHFLTFCPVFLLGFLG